VLLKGEWTSAIIDHKDRNTANDCIENLREATESQNHANSKVYRSSISGIKGVHQIPSTGKWRAKIRVNNRQIHLGCFDRSDDAKNAYENAARKHFGEFASVSA
jgi:hypothetical protein